MIHLYHGDGKGKTTAACGLALRAAGHGQRVLFAQFFKDGTSGEIAAMGAVPGIETRCPPVHYGRYGTLSEEQRREIGEVYPEYFAKIVAEAGGYELVILDEVVPACNYGVVDRGAVMDFLREQGGRREIVLTGRGPGAELVEAADYVTEMRKGKHPFDRGVGARGGVEF